MEWLVALALMIGMIWVLAWEHKRRQSRTEEEYQQDVAKAGKSPVGAGLLELQKILQPESRLGIEYVIDQQQGMTGEKDTAGDDGDERVSG